MGEFSVRRQVAILRDIHLPAPVEIRTTKSKVEIRTTKSKYSESYPAAAHDLLAAVFYSLRDVFAS